MSLTLRHVPLIIGAVPMLCLAGCTVPLTYTPPNPLAGPVAVVSGTDVPSNDGLHMDYTVFISAVDKVQNLNNWGSWEAEVGLTPGTHDVTATITHGPNVSGDFDFVYNFVGGERYTVEISPSQLIGNCIVSKAWLVDQTGKTVSGPVLVNLQGISSAEIPVGLGGGFMTLTTHSGCSGT